MLPSVERVCGHREQWQVSRQGEWCSSVEHYSKCRYCVEKGSEILSSDDEEEGWREWVEHGETLPA